MGGAAAFATATLPGLRAAVSFYGGSIANPFPKDTPAIDDTPDIKVPLFLAYGGKDDYIPKEAREKIEAHGGTCEVIPPPKKPVRNKMGQGNRAKKKWPEGT